MALPRAQVSGRNFTQATVQICGDSSDHAGVVFLEKFNGHFHLFQSTQSFALETLVSLDSNLIGNIAKNKPHFPLIFVDYLMLYRRLRAAQLLSLKGYAGPAYALLRDVADKSIQLSAFQQGMVTYEDLMGIRKDDNPKATNVELNNRRRAKRVSLEKELIDNFYGRKSGLEEDDVRQMEIWGGLNPCHSTFVVILVDLANNDCKGGTGVGVDNNQQAVARLGADASGRAQRLTAIYADS